MNLPEITAQTLDASAPRAMEPAAAASPAARGARRHLLRWSLAALKTAAVLLLVGGLFLGVQQLVGNFHTVVPGQLYRSAQLDAGQIAEMQKTYGIKTIINLRGPSSARWYTQEVAEAERLGVNHIDFTLSAQRELTQQQVEELVALMRDAPKPILVHCKGGSDRSGIASALYIAAIAKGTEEAAERQLSLFYGHFPFPFFPAWAMDETFERVEPWLGFHGS